MRTTHRGQRWLGIVADTDGATLYAVEGSPPDPTLIAIQQVSYDAEKLAGASPAGVQEFVAEHDLAGCDAHLHFAGAGTVVHKLHMPVMKARLRARAIRTRLTAYAAGRELCFGQRVDQHQRGDKDVNVLAAGVDAKLVRGLLDALTKLGLRVCTVTSLIDAFAPPVQTGNGVQVVLGDRTTVIQLFKDGGLAFCRNVLFGRQDFVSAFQRPILTQQGPLTLSPERAELLVREVGASLGGQTTPIESVHPEQLWPLVAPVLQKLQNELVQTLQQHWGNSAPDAALSVLCVPRVPGVAQYLASELRLDGSTQPEHVEAAYLTGLHGGSGSTPPVDLLPPEERFVRRLMRPALTTAACALLIIAGNASSLRAVRAERSQTEPAVFSLQDRLEAVEAKLGAAREEHDALADVLTQRARLLRAMPTDVPAIAVCRALLGTVPEQVTLRDVSLDSGSVPASAELVASYRGSEAAGAVAAEWARCVATLPICVRADVTSVDGNGREQDATIAIRVFLR